MAVGDSRLVVPVVLVVCMVVVVVLWLLVVLWLVGLGLDVLSVAVGVTVKDGSRVAAFL